MLTGAPRGWRSQVGGRIRTWLLLGLATAGPTPNGAGPAQLDPLACRIAAEPVSDGIALSRPFGGGRLLCLRAGSGVRLDDGDGAILEIPPGRSLTIATTAPGGSRELRVTAAGGEPSYDWRVDGKPSPFDAAAREWMADALEAAARLREVEATSAEAARLQREIAEARERERGLRDEIGAILAERSRLQSEIGSIQGEEAELRAQIAGLRGEESELRVEAGSHRVAVADLEARLGEAAAEERGEIEAEIEHRRAAIEEIGERLLRDDHARRIEALEARLRGLATGERVALIEARVAALDVDDRLAELEQRSQSLGSRELITALRRRLDALDPEARIAGIEAGLEPLLARLMGRPSGS